MSASSQESSEELKKRLHSKISDARASRCKKSTNTQQASLTKKDAKRCIRSQSVNGVLKSLGLENNETVKAELVEAMRSGKITNVSELSQWLALHAPLGTGMNPSDALLVKEVAAAADAAASKSLGGLMDPKS